MGSLCSEMLERRDLVDRISKDSMITTITAC